MMKKISVLICTHNPRKEYLNRVLKALISQTLSPEIWELLIIDNASADPNYVPSFDLSWHQNAQIILEKKLGLTWARIAGIKASQSPYLVFVDDDNVLEPNYLKKIIEIFQANPDLGSIGGKSIPEFEIQPEPWFAQVNLHLGCRDLGEEVQTYYYSKTTQHPKKHPDFAPVGAGMALQREAAEIYMKKITATETSLVLDRTGKNLSSGGDCDINLTLLDEGWGVGYFPQLKLTHLIPAGRLTKDYLAHLNRGISCSWVQVLDLHEIRPWSKIPRWTVCPRKVRAFFNYQPWKDPVSYIRWQGACGMFEGRAKLL